MVSAMNVVSLKQQAAEHAVTFVETGMVVGLGAGSMAVFAVPRIADLLHVGTLRNVVGSHAPRRSRPKHAGWASHLRRSTNSPSST